MSLDIRVAGAADLDGILALYAQPEIDDGEVLSVGEARALFDRMTAYPDYRLFVAVEDKVVVGTFALLIMDNLGHLGAPSAIIEDVAVAPARQGRGIGRAMMARALGEARLRGCYKAMLSSDLKRADAHGFYDDLGFARHGYSFRFDLEAVA